jgi:hypothetical protein
MRNGWPLLLLALALGGCDRYHNPADTTKIKELQALLDAANLRADTAQAQLAAETEAEGDRARLADAAERSADAQEAQAASAADQAAAAQEQADAEASK